MKKFKICAYIFGIMTLSFAAIFYTHVFFANDNSVLIPIFAILTSLIASCVVIFIFDVVVKAETDKDLSALVKNTVDTSVHQALGIHAAGIRGIHERFINQKFIKSAKKSNKIHILQTYAPNLSAIKPAITDVLDRGGEVNIALLNPESPYVAIRASEIADNNRKELSASINKSISYLEHYTNEKKRKGVINLKLYDRSPGVCIYSTDELMFVGVFLSNEDSISSPQVELDANTMGYSIFVDHFQTIWDKSTKRKL